MTKHPCLHPGDIRRLRAVRVDKLESCARDCIIFSVQGHRPNFHEMAGSDLDGDQYWVYWGDELQFENIVPSLLYLPAEKKPDKQVTNERTSSGLCT